MQSHSPDRIAQLAYQLWQERGCPEGSPEVDWERATRMLEQNQADGDNEVLASTITRVPAESPAAASRGEEPAPVAQPVPPVLQPVSQGGTVHAESAGSPGTGEGDPSAVIAQSRSRSKGRNARRSAI